MQLIEALRYTGHKSMAFVGAGGKTTAIFRLAREFAGRASPGAVPGTVLVSTTTHLGTWQVSLADHYCKVTSINDLARLRNRLPAGVILLAGEEIDQRITGVDEESLVVIKNIAEELQIPLLIEADGSRMRPLKAPAEHEPSIPDFIQEVVVVAGLSGLGKPLSDQWVHRPEIFGQLSGLNPNEEITIEALVKVLTQRRGGLKNIPPTAQKALLLNQADSAELQAQGKAIAMEVIADYPSIIIASLAAEDGQGTADAEGKKPLNDGIHCVVERVAGIVLAAGSGSRFGKVKQLLPWNGQPLIRHVVLAALNAGLSPVVVVLGAAAEEIKPVISDLPVRIVNNQGWEIGLSTSIRAGIKALAPEIGGAIFLLADQPQVSPSLIRSLIDAHQCSLAPIIAPHINGQRGNPVLFDEKTFSSFQMLEREQGGRELFSQYPVQWVTWQDVNQLMDIDTPADYKKFLEFFPDWNKNL